MKKQNLNREWTRMNANISHWAYAQYVAEQRDGLQSCEVADICRQLSYSGF